MTFRARAGAALTKRRRHIVTVAWLVATLALAVASRFVSWGRAWFEIRSARPAWLLVAIVLNGAILLLWATLWQVIRPRRRGNAGRRVSIWRLAEIAALVSMVLNTVPFVGEASAVVLLARRGGLGTSAALSVIAIDQLLLGVAKVLLLLAVAALVPLPPWMREGIVALSVAVAVALAILLAFAHHGHRWQSADARAVGPNDDIVDRLWRAATGWAHHLEGLRSGSKFFGGLALEICKKSAETGAIVAIQHAFGRSLPLGDALFVLAALNLVTVIPVSPANLGVYEATVYFAYKYLGLPDDVALGIGVVQHVCYLLPLAGTGWVVLSWRQVRERWHR